MDERDKLARWHQTGRYTVTELARQLGISRKTAHKWLERFDQEGSAGLADRPRTPHRQPRATAPAVVAAVLRAKQAHPTWGPLKLLPEANEPAAVVAGWPAPSTRAAILDRHGMVQRRRHRRRVVPASQPLAHAVAPNDVWCADFKGWFRTADGTRCDPATITDASSRMLLCCQIVRPDYEHLRPAFERTFRAYGLPAVIRTDNGPPFASLSAGGLSRLAIWWVKLGILPERIAAGHPEQNGRHERMHRTLKAECCRPPAATPVLQQDRFDSWRREFNEQRPHQALGQVPPAQQYRPSPRPYPERLSDLEYPVGTQVRRVRSNGQLKWQGRHIFVSETLIGELVGITEGPAGWSASFGPIHLGILDTVRERLLKQPYLP
jgi:transposase InsO family protein